MPISLRLFLGWVITLTFVGGSQAWATNHCPFVLLSTPKYGTFLNIKTLSLIVQEPCFYFLDDELGSSYDVVRVVREAANQGKFTVAHEFKERDLKALVRRGYKIVFSMRDPRDAIVSVSNWMREGSWPVRWNTYAAKMQDQNEQIEELIAGHTDGWNCVEWLLSHEDRLEGLPPDSVHYSRFENLVGSQGGGSDEKQIEEVLALASFLEMSLTTEEAEKIAQQIFGGTYTFRQGQVGSWKAYFTEHHKALFKERYNDHLIRLSYEKDDLW